MSPSNVRVDRNFIEFYNIELLQGRSFSDNTASDSERAFIVNEAMLDYLGWKEVDGAQIGITKDSMRPVIGVVRNFNFNSLHHEIQPLVISAQDIGFYEISVKLASNTIDDTIGKIESIWPTFAGDKPFSYTFLDAHFEQLYSADRQAGIIISWVAGLTTVVSCLGLFGLASFAIEQRIKELGIRKVLGATAKDILALLYADFSKLVFIAIVIASPIAWYFVNDWLQSFAYRISPQWWVFLIASLVLVVITWLTISARATTTLLQNPVNSLRSE
jgi:putative ABC transport system permease protein